MIDFNKKSKRFDAKKLEQSFVDSTFSKKKHFTHTNLDTLTCVVRYTASSIHIVAKICV